MHNMHTSVLLIKYSRAASTRSMHTRLVYESDAYVIYDSYVLYLLLVGSIIIY